MSGDVREWFDPCIDLSDSVSSRVRSERQIKQEYNWEGCGVYQTKIYSEKTGIGWLMTSRGAPVKGGFSLWFPNTLQTTQVQT